MRTTLLFLLPLSVACAVTEPFGAPDTAASGDQGAGGTNTQEQDGTSGDGADGGTDGTADGADGAADGTDGSGGTDGSDGTDGSGGTEDPCPSGVTCVTTFPFSETNTTTGAASDVFDSYSCGSQDESGPEVVYRLTLPDDGFVAIDLPQDQMAAGADIDVHLLSANREDACLSRGHWRAGGFVPAGEYWVVADTWVSSTGVENHGQYGITIGFTSVSDLIAEGMQQAAAEDGLSAFDVAWDRGDTDRFTYAITDFSVPSDQIRQWVLDLASNQVLWRLYIPHGEGSSRASDSRYADTFSNTPESHQSSLGMVRAAETYSGTYGYSMRLDGLEPGTNDNVRSRFIVVHPWSGSRASYVASWGEAAPTWGCPAVDDLQAEDIVDTLAGGSLLFYWHTNAAWQASSPYL